MNIINVPKGFKIFNSGKYVDKTTHYDIVLAPDCEYELIDKLDGANFSVISFSNEATQMCPFNNNTEYVKSVVRSLQTIDSLYAKGSSYGTAEEVIENAVNQAKAGSDSKVAVFYISDGEITNEEAKRASFSPLKDIIDDGAVLGYGTVGSGVIEVIRTNQSIVNKKAEQDINIKYVLDLRDFPGDPVEEILVHDFNTIVEDPEVDIVVEVMGGTGAAYTFVKNSLLAGKSVCTSNKALVAKYGPELMAIAKEKNVNFLFEASVGGGIPILRPLKTSITADKIEAIIGILNGTTNYILTQMATEGWDFDSALKKAQEMGFAEANPEADIEGHDACRKIAILLALVAGKHVDFEKIYTEGISKITATDIEYAKKCGRAIKLLASAKEVNGKYVAMVAPFMLTASHPLFNVNSVFNAIFVTGNVLGDVMFYGSGAGKLPTASAVVSDVVEAAKNLDKNLGMGWDEEELELVGVEDSSSRFFVRVSGNKSDRLADIEAIFGNVETIELGSQDDEFGFITNTMTEKAFGDSVDKVSGVISRIRVEN